jgi:hypothetical protein
LLSQANVQRDRARKTSDDATARLADARATEKTTRTRLQGDFASESVELTTQLRGTSIFL